MHGEQSVIHTVQVDTPLGAMVAGASDRGICLLDFVADKRSVKQRVAAACEDLCTRLRARVVAIETTSTENSHLVQLQSDLTEYFAGQRRFFSLPLDTPGTAFQQGVWQVLQTIPYAQTWSYGQQAIAMRNPKAVRAIASANARNRISIIIPCHRVIGADGALVGYGGGVARKEWLIDFERS